ncbi:hypothetical protein ROZALSC1DRAFT_26429, partial [Rozella allomycis CSF55]
MTFSISLVPKFEKEPVYEYDQSGNEIKELQKSQFHDLAERYTKSKDEKLKKVLEEMSWAKSELDVASDILFYLTQNPADAIFASSSIEEPKKQFNTAVKKVNYSLKSNMLQESYTKLDCARISISSSIKQNHNFYLNLILPLREKRWKLFAKNGKIFVDYSGTFAGFEAELVTRENEFFIDLPNHHKTKMRVYLNGMPLIVYQELINDLEFINMLEGAKRNVENIQIFERICRESQELRTLSSCQIKDNEVFFTFMSKLFKFELKECKEKIDFSASEASMNSILFSKLYYREYKSIVSSQPQKSNLIEKFLILSAHLSNKNDIANFLNSSGFKYRLEMLGEAEHSFKIYNSKGIQICYLKIQNAFSLFIECINFDQTLPFDLDV